MLPNPFLRHAEDHHHSLSPYNFGRNSKIRYTIELYRLNKTWLKNCRKRLAGVGDRSAVHVTNTKSASRDVGTVHIGAVQEPIVKQDDFARFKFKVDRLVGSTEFFCLFFG